MNSRFLPGHFDPVDITSAEWLVLSLGKFGF